MGLFHSFIHSRCKGQMMAMEGSDVALGGERKLLPMSQHRITAVVIAWSRVDPYESSRSWSPLRCRVSPGRYWTLLRVVEPSQLTGCAHDPDILRQKWHPSPVNPLGGPCCPCMQWPTHWPKPTGASPFFGSSSLFLFPSRGKQQLSKR